MKFLTVRWRCILLILVICVKRSSLVVHTYSDTSKHTATTKQGHSNVIGVRNPLSKRLIYKNTLWHMWSMNPLSILLRTKLKTVLSIFTLVIFAINRLDASFSCSAIWRHIVVCGSLIVESVVRILCRRPTYRSISSRYIPKHTCSTSKDNFIFTEVCCEFPKIVYSLPLPQVEISILYYTLFSNIKNWPAWTEFIYFLKFSPVYYCIEIFLTRSVRQSIFLGFP